MAGLPEHGAVLYLTPGLAALVERTRRLAAIETLVRTWLPAALAPQVGVANLREDTLVLSVKSAAWATKLRYEVPAVLAAAKRHEATRAVRDVKIKVMVGGDAV